MERLKKITLQQRRILLLLHILFAAIMFGVQVAFIILALTASVTDDAAMLKSCYTIMHLLADSSVRASTIGTAVTGIALSVLTSWGLFRYYWVIAKEVLTLLAIGIGFIGLYEWTLRGLDDNGSLTVHHTWLMIGIALQTISIIVMYILSVWKPGGKRKTPAL
ncbi:hypothetical protein PghCCS26_51480 [Paenibacillus glycanilyticus]|uniref:DUF2269 family protein n=1 Tax=Paenibacillus glycanilyticus TaxID=126569 RepID=A0ABQ6NT32_9BACL|nr:hypothetical protein [Paenibacillus glycanilyticus]GMK48018.1 hypothetical protein PghCCS26_51480 [Paenibacillus glycanilyticus]